MEKDFVVLKGEIGERRAWPKQFKARLGNLFAVALDAALLASLHGEWKLVEKYEGYGEGLRDALNLLEVMCDESNTIKEADCQSTGTWEAGVAEEQPGA